MEVLKTKLFHKESHLGSLFIRGMMDILLEQSEIIGKLSALCERLINELAQYKCIEEEEKKLNQIMEN